MTQFYPVILFISGAIVLGVIIQILQRGKSPSGLTLIFMMTGMVIWCWTYALHWLYPNNPEPFFWLDATYIGAATTPTIIFIFALQLAYPNFHIKKRHFLLLAIEPVSTLIILWTDPYHQLFFGGLRHPGDNTIYNGGVFFWGNIAYTYCLLALALIYFISGMIHARSKVYRAQLIFCTLGMIFPVIASILGILHMYPLPGLDLIPISFIVTGLFFTISLRTYHLLDFVPIVNNVLLDQMGDGMIVLDLQRRIVDANAVAIRFLNMPKSSLVGQSISQIDLLKWIYDDLSEDLNQSTFPYQKILSGPYLNKTTLDIQINSLESNNKVTIGYLVLWRDITHIKEIEDQLRHANATLKDQLQQIEILQKTLIEQAIRDPLTGLFNRRFLENTIPKELARADRLSLPISFLVLDIDHFKRINDTFGHDVGDKVLRNIAVRIDEANRSGDWVVRYGGEEILVVLVDTEVDEAVAKAETLRHDIQEIRFPNIPHKITVSIGVSAYPKHGQDWQCIFRAADEAMYVAKAAGRNCVRISTR